MSIAFFACRTCESHLPSIYSQALSASAWIASTRAAIVEKLQAVIEIMIDPNGRYKGTPTLIHRARDGTVSPYLARRFLPKGTGAVIARVTVSQGMRLDLIADRWRDDATRSWEIADANRAMNPFALTARIGRTLVVTQPST